MSEDDGRMADDGEIPCGATTRIPGIHNTFECDLLPGHSGEHRDYHLLHAWDVAS